MDQLRTSVVRDILKYGAFLQRIGDRILRSYGTTQQEFAVLSAIARDAKPLYQTTIVVDLLVERSNLSKIVKRLQAKGLIEVLPTEGDRRRRLLNLSPSGLDLFMQADVALQRWNKEWMEGFDRSDLCALSGLLSRLKSSSDEKLGDDAAARGAPPAA
jgi:DNA-binding MarR family transcriptional regulator